MAGLIAAGTLICAAGSARAAYNDVASAGHADMNLGYDAVTRSPILISELASGAVINGATIGSEGRASGARTR